MLLEILHVTGDFLASLLWCMHGITACLMLLLPSSKIFLTNRVKLIIVSLTK